MFEDDVIRIIPVYLKPKKMEKVNIITNVDIDRQYNLCDKWDFEVHPELEKYVSKISLNLLKENETDYIEFRRNDSK